MSSVLIYALGWMGMRGEGIPQIISILQMADYKNIKFSIFCHNKICIKMNTLSQDKMLIIKKLKSFFFFFLSPSCFGLDGDPGLIPGFGR